MYGRAGSGSSTWGSISRVAGRGPGWAGPLHAAGLLAVCFVLAVAARADTGGSPASAPSDTASSFATLRIESLPSGLSVLVDDVWVGRTPIDSLRVSARPLRVRVVAPDPRRFNPARDATSVTPHPGSTVSVFLDVRPSVLLRTVPEPTSVFFTRSLTASPDSLLGETPHSIAPAVIEGGLLRFVRESFADTTLAAARFLHGVPESLSVRLRSTGGVAASPLGPPSRTPLVRKSWFQWTLVGVGAVLTGTAIALHRQGDDSYEQYLASSDVDEIPELYDQAVEYDRWAAVSLGVGQVSMITGLVLLLTGQSR